MSNGRRRDRTRRDADIHRIDNGLTDSDPDVAQSFHAFVGADGYALTDLQADLNRFATLLNGLEISAHDLHTEPFLTRPTTGHTNRGDVKIHGYTRPGSAPSDVRFHR